jgi:hypothetical protein
VTGELIADDVMAGDVKTREVLAVMLGRVISER